jgi:cell division transport system permease protein
MLTSFKRIIRSGFVGFWRNAFVSLSAIFVIAITLLVVGGTILFDQLLNTSLDHIQDKVDINVYLHTTAEEQEVLNLKASLESLGDVREVVYTSREEALELFRARHQDDELTIQALEELNENPLGATLSIRARETSQYESIAIFLEESRAAEAQENPLIDRINYNDNKEAIAKLTSIVDAVEQASFVTMLVLIVSSVLIAFNTIRLAIYASREEVSVMRLVGASNMFIRGPFIFQGIMYGLVSGIVALLILYPVAVWLGPVTEAFFLFNIFEYFVNNFGYLFSVLVGSGIILGTFSSTLAIARYLKV